MTNIIKYYNKQVYGRDCNYVIDKDQAEAIKTLTEKQSLSRDHIEALKKLGFFFEQVIDPKV
jgi:hypothetical protein